MFRSSRYTALFLFSLSVTLSLPTRGFTAEKKAEKKKAEAPAVGGSADPNQAGEMLEVEKVKEKYWAQGQDSKMGVVQNRLFSKEHKFALGILGGTSIADPFLAIKNYGLTVGYHFNEFVGVSLVGWKNKVGSSSALKTAEEQGKDQNTVDPNWFAGGEVLGSVMYGKLSLLGARIIYYDMHLSLGAGMTSFERFKASGKSGSATSITGIWGIGQRFYVTQGLSLRLDYRNQIYKETIREKVITANLGDDIGDRTVFAHTINASLDFMFGI